MMRAVASVPPPAPQGTISVTGRSGQAAPALPIAMQAAATASILTNMLRFMAPPSVPADCAERKPRLPAESP